MNNSPVSRLRAHVQASIDSGASVAVIGVPSDPLGRACSWMVTDKSGKVTEVFDVATVIQCSTHPACATIETSFQYLGRINKAIKAAKSTL